MALGRNVKLVRELRGFTQKELSDRTEGVVSQAALSALESRDSKRSVFLKELAKALCVPTATLLKTNIDLNELQAQPIVAWEDPRGGRLCRYSGIRTLFISREWFRE